MADGKPDHFFTTKKSFGDNEPDEWWTDFQVDVKGTMAVTKQFLSFVHAADKKVHVIYMSSGAGPAIIPENSAYSLAKMGDLQMAAYLAAENENVVAVAVHPGIVATEMADAFWKPFAKDRPELVGRVVLWLISKQAEFMSGKDMSSKW